MFESLLERTNDLKWTNERFQVNKSQRATTNRKMLEKLLVQIDNENSNQSNLNDVVILIASDI